MVRNVAKNVDLRTLFLAIILGPSSDILVSDEGSFNVTTLHQFLSQFGSVEAWKIEGKNNKGFSPVNVPN